MTLGSGIAVAGIWIGVGLIAFDGGDVGAGAAAVASIFATMATLFVALASDRS